jgi:16S rRNA (cytosine967-C5)-methyltransferase
MKTAQPIRGDDSQPSHIGRSVARGSLEQTDTYLRRLDEGHPVRLAPGESLLTRNVVLEICRRRGQLDWFLKQMVPKSVKGRLRRLLYWALAEILWLDGLPNEVAANVCVEVAKQRYNAREAGFINALLRKTLQGDPCADFAACLAEAPPWVQLSLPEVLWKRWRRHLSPEQLADLAAVLLKPSELHVRVRKIGDDLPFLEPEHRVPWAPTSVFRRCLNPQELFASPDWQNGRFYVQDPATMLACALLAPQPNEAVADLCAAPGGKSLALAEALGGTGQLTCLDRSARRLQRVAKNLGKRRNCTLAVGDAAAPPFLPDTFDAVLLDVPCSNTGVIRKNPDVRWRFSVEDLASLVKLQSEILNGAAPLVRPGGRLVYSTCSIEPEENTENVACFLANHPGFLLVDEQQLLPADGNDGAYAALLRKRAD